MAPFVTMMTLDRMLMFTIFLFTFLLLINAPGGSSPTGSARSVSLVCLYTFGSSSLPFLFSHPRPDLQRNTDLLMCFMAYSPFLLSTARIGRRRLSFFFSINDR